MDNQSRGNKKKSFVSKKIFQIDVFALDKLIIPIHLTNHWCLAVIDFSKKEFQYYDSLGGGQTCFSVKFAFSPHFYQLIQKKKKMFLQELKKYLKDEHKDKKQKELDLTGWKEYVPKDIPHQQNGYDCGVFMW